MGLTATQIKGNLKSGKYSDGKGLLLNVAPGGSKNWVFRITIDGKRRDIGLGGYPGLTLGKAREKAAEYRADVAKGIDPRDKTAKRKVPTFIEAAHACHSFHRDSWRSAEHAEQWINTLALHAFPIFGDQPVDQITGADVLNVLTPIWHSKAETARRLRQRIRTTFKWCLANGYVSSNPAGEILDGALPKQKAIKTHWRALNYSDLPDAMRMIHESTSGIAAKLAFEFLILTAARSGEVRGATWNEIDVESRTWTIPANRMKAGKEHRVPLSDAAMDVLERARAIREGDYIFPSPQKRNSGLSDMTFTKIFRTLGIAERSTVHGLRSTFTDWVAEQQDGKGDEAHAALAHAPGRDAVERAYLRTDLLDKRRELMDQWGEFVASDKLNP